MTEWPMSMLDRIEEEKSRSCAVFANNLRCADAVRRFVASNQQNLLHLAMLQDGSGTSPRRQSDPTLANTVVDVKQWPKNVRCLYHFLHPDPGLLTSVSSLVWFADELDPIPPVAQSGWFSCALNVALGQRYGLPLDCFDACGRRIRSPMVGAFADFLNNTLFDWEVSRRDFTSRIKAEGLVFSPGYCEPALWSIQGGAIDVGDLALSLALIWRIRRFEIWTDSYDPEDPSRDADEAEWLAEEQECVRALRAELGEDVHVKVR